MPGPDDLLEKRLILVMGKGGVGKTTVAATLASILARRGKRTLLYQANARQRLARLLDGPRVGEDIVALRDNLWAVNTHPAAAIHEYGVMILKFETVYRMVMENRFAKSLLRAIPGLDDYSIVGKMWFHTTETEAGRPKWDTIVFDAPATGHAINMLRIPRDILQTVPDGPLTRDARKVQELLTDPERTATVLVTLAEEMPTNEAIELYQKAHGEMGINVPYVLVNQLYPDRFRPDTPPRRVLDALESRGGIDGLSRATLARARTICARRELNEEYLSRLEKEIRAPQLHLPLVFTESFGAGDVERLSHVLEEQLAAS